MGGAQATTLLPIVGADGSGFGQLLTRTEAHTATAEISWLIFVHERSFAITPVPADAIRQQLPSYLRSRWRAIRYGRMNHYSR